MDRVRRRPLLMVSNACTGAAVLLLLLVHGPGQVWPVHLVMALYSLAYTLLGSGQSALLTVLVPGDLLPDGNGALRTVQETLRLFTPLAGAGLFVLVEAHVVARACTGRPRSSASSSQSRAPAPFPAARPPRR